MSLSFFLSFFFKKFYCLYCKNVDAAWTPGDCYANLHKYASNILDFFFFFKKSWKKLHKRRRRRTQIWVESFLNKCILFKDLWLYYSFFLHKIWFIVVSCNETKFWKKKKKNYAILGERRLSEREEKEEKTTFLMAKKGRNQGSQLMKNKTLQMNINYQRELLRRKT